jgi:hypothetical protein
MDELDVMNHIFRNSLIRINYLMKEIESELGKLRLAQNTYSQFLDQCFAELQKKGGREKD